MPQVDKQNEPRIDGWKNILTGLGISNRDKRLGDSFAFDRLSQEYLEELWRGDDMAATIVEKLPDEMTREWFDVQIQAESEDENTKELSEAIETTLEEINTYPVLRDALCYERAYGGAAVLLGADDGTKDLREPLQVNRIRSVRWLTLLSPRELTAAAYYSNPLSPQFGRPAVFRVHPIGGNQSQGSLEVHESRFLLFPGIQTTRQQVLENQGFGDSALQRCYRVISDYQMTWSSAAVLMRDFSQAVFKIKGLAELLAADKDDAVIKRVQTLDICRSVLRALVLDEGEDFERKATPLTGFSEVLEQFATRLAASADMPVTLLMGQSPAGLNATGESDIRFFYDRVKARQRTKLKPALKKLIQLIFLSKEGPTRGKEPQNWSIAFRPLWQLSELQAAEVRQKQAQTDKNYLETGVLTTEEVASSRFGGDAYSTETELDPDITERLATKQSSSIETQPEETGEER